jgi:OOP family OmpA-OmpF porin
MQLAALVARWMEMEADSSIRISGHGDAGEKEGVERALSMARAEAVAKALADIGVDRGRITTEAHAASKPRRANFRPDGSEDTAGRRLNRRVEIRFAR